MTILTKSAISKYIIFLLLLFPLAVFAQVPAQFRNDVDRMHRNAQMQNLQSKMQYRQFNLMNLMNFSGSTFNHKSYYSVFLKDSTLVTAHSKIYFDTLTQKSYVQYKDKSLKKSDPLYSRKVFVDQTTSISFDRNDREGIAGFPTDSCWHFRQVSGTVSLYSYYADVDEITINYCLSAFQLEKGGPLFSFQIEENVNALEDLIGKDGKETKYYKLYLQGKYYDAVRMYNEKHKTN